MKVPFLRDLRTDSIKIDSNIVANLDALDYPGRPGDVARRPPEDAGGDNTVAEISASRTSAIGRKALRLRALRHTGVADRSGRSVGPAGGQALAAARKAMPLNWCAASAEPQAAYYQRFHHCEVG
jgi:hypothetical protein